MKRRLLSCPAKQLQRGYTLLELLVSLAIIAFMLALLMPAVQTVREAARRSECWNHLRQLNLAFLQHHDAHGFYPSGGWGHDVSFGWGGVPDRGFGKKQPGGWAYTTLPYIEYRSLYDLGIGLEGVAYRDAGTQRVQTSLPIHHCPSRRRATVYPNGNMILKPLSHYHVVPFETLVAKGDYAANLGDPPDTFGLLGAPDSLEQVDSDRFPWPTNPRHRHTGISFGFGEIGMKMITDGTTNTYMIGEKYLSTEAYTDGTSGGDDGTIYASHNSDNHRSALSRPRRDAVEMRKQIFGSAHAEVFHMAFCDGSVRAISYSVDAAIHRASSTRDGDEVAERAALEGPLLFQFSGRTGSK